jgi:hypothetical protein
VRSAAAASSSLLGKKVSVLYRTDDDPQYPLNEVVGIVQRVEPGPDAPSLFVAKRDGTLVEVAGGKIVKIKVVPTKTR